MWSKSDVECDSVDCCSLLWLPLQHTRIVDESCVEFKLPDSIVGVSNYDGWFEV